MGKALDKLLAAVEELCKTYVGKDAEGEAWGDTCRRLGALDKLVKRARKELAK